MEPVELKPLLNMKQQKVHPQQRIPSCVGSSPQEVALSAYQQRNYKTFLDCISELGFDPNCEYGDDVPRTLAEIILEEAEGRDIFLLALLQSGGRSDIRNQVTETVPFHESIRKQDPALLKVSLRGVRDINVQDGEGSSALHLATEGLLDAEESSADNLVEIISILLQVPGIEVDGEDLKGECTPLYYAALAASERAVDLLLSFGANYSKLCSGEKIQDIIRKNIAGFDASNYKAQRGSRPLKNVLFNLIELADNITGFKNYTQNRKETDWNADNGQFTLLQYAADQGRAQIAGYLIESGAEICRTASNDTPPIVLAAYHGYHKVLQVFLDSLKDAELKTVMVTSDLKHGRRTLLHQIVRQHSPKLENPFRDESIDYEKCLQVLFDDRKLGRGRSKYSHYTERIINFRDSYGETALHYATQQPNQEIIKLLLRHGANMGVKNLEGKPPVNRILPSTLQEFLDDCIQSEGIITDDDLLVKFDYKFLAPPLLDTEILQQFELTKEQKMFEAENARNPRPETEALWYLSESKSHRSLLKHPVISSFLLMKWLRIRTFYIVSLVTYFLFVVSLTTLILIDYGGCSLFTSEAAQEVNAASESAASTTAAPQTDAVGAEGSSCRVDSTVWRVIVGIFLTLLALLELVQLVVSVKRYLASFTNYIELAIITCASILVLDSSLDWETRRHMAALLIIFSWSEFIIMVGTHPSLSTNVIMLFTVVGTFFKFLLWYTTFIIAFALAFYIMFHAESQPGEEPKHFDEIGTCIVKTSAMFVGELEFSDIPFTSNPVSYIIFVAFLFLVVVVLMNLLNGLAVSDTGLIREEAEVLSLKSQVDLISYWESILLNDPYNFLTSWPKFLSSLPSLSCCFWVKRIPILETLIGKIVGGTRILLFYECLPDKCASFYPNNDRKKSCIPYRKKIQAETNSGQKSSNLQVPKDVLDSAKIIIMDREKTSEIEVQTRRLVAVEEQLSLLTQTIQTLVNSRAS